MGLTAAVHTLTQHKHQFLNYHQSRNIPLRRTNNPHLHHHPIYDIPQYKSKQRGKKNRRQHCRWRVGVRMGKATAASITNESVVVKHNGVDSRPGVARARRK